MKRAITLNVNGDEYEVLTEPHWTLLHVLREQIGLTGTKRGCDSGDCGACTVNIDGRPALSCLTLAIECPGKKVLTIEGLAKDGKLNPLQESFVKYGAVQCGFCIPGMIMSAKVLYDRKATPTVDEVKKAIAGNLCRCTGYIKIIEAIVNAHKFEARGLISSSRRNI